MKFKCEQIKYLVALSIMKWSPQKQLILAISTQGEPLQVDIPVCMVSNTYLLSPPPATEITFDLTPLPIKLEKN